MIEDRGPVQDPYPGDRERAGAGRARIIETTVAGLDLGHAITPGVWVDGQVECAIAADRLTTQPLQVSGEGVRCDLESIALDHPLHRRGGECDERGEDAERDQELQQGEAPSIDDRPRLPRWPARSSVESVP